jgi:hypothetical protein
VIDRKYLEMFRQLDRTSAQTALEPMPGWFARRKRDIPAATEILSRLPAGAAAADADSRRDRPA